MTKVAKSLVERERAVSQVQGHPDSTYADVVTAFTISRFVNSKSGVAFAGHDVYARIMRISPRSFKTNLSRLVARGHVVVTRRGPHPAEIALVLLPDCVPENEVKPSDTCFDDNEVKPDLTSLPANEVKNTSTSFFSKEVKFDSKKKCKTQKNLASKSNGYEPITKEEPGNKGKTGKNIDAETPSDAAPLPDYFDVPGDGEILAFGEVNIEGAPPIDQDGLEATLAFEATREQPAGWNEYAKQIAADASPIVDLPARVRCEL